MNAMVSIPAWAFVTLCVLCVAWQISITLAMRSLKSLFDLYLKAREEPEVIAWPQCAHGYVGACAICATFRPSSEGGANG